MATENYSSIIEYNCARCSVSLFSFRVRDLCPKCNQSLEVDQSGGADLGFQIHEPPFGLSKPHSLVVQLTGGHPFSRYTTSALLHVGVTTSQGGVFHFDEGGLHYDEFWPQCISVPLFPTATPVPENWDNELRSFHEIRNTQRSSQGFHTLENNCYNYVIGFLNHISYEQRTNHTKIDIVRHHIEPVVQVLESFLNIHREVYNKGYFATESGYRFVSKTTYTCNNCSQRIEKAHYRCQNCEDFDLCEYCLSLDPEIDGHKSSHTLALQE